MSDPTSVGGPRDSGVSLARDLVALTHPRRAALGLVVVVLGALVAGPRGLTVATATHLAAGSLLAFGGASVLNQVAERSVDARMRRTAHRPLPSGRLGRRPALVFGLALALGGLAELAAGVGAATAGGAACGLVTYLLVYTPLKRVTPLSTVAGAVAGAVPVLMGWAGVRGGIGAGGWSLFAIVFLWQIPHYLAIAWIHRADYRRAGLRSLAGSDPQGTTMARLVVVSSAVLIPLSLAPAVDGTVGTVYRATALLLGLGYLAFAAALGRQRTTGCARRVVTFSLAYLPVLLAVLALDGAMT